MTTLTHSFEAGVGSGTAITTANSATGGNAFDALDPTTLGSGAVREYNNNKKTGSLATLCSSTTSSGRAAVSWTTSMGTKSSIYMRYYAYQIAQDAGLSSGPRFFRVFSGTTNRAQVGLDGTGGHVVIANAAGTTIGTTSAVVPTLTWYRVEAFIQLSTSATWEVRYYGPSELEGTTPTETISGSSANFGGTGTVYNFGHTTTDIGVSIYLDDIGIDDTTWLGPSVAFTRFNKPLVAQSAAITRSNFW